MFGIKYIKFDSMTYVIHYSSGRIAHEGRGLAFYYYAPSSSISAIPLGSRDLQFMFYQTTQDFQTVSIQGQITYKIADHKQISEMLDFTLDERQQYKVDNFEKLNQRLNNEALTTSSAYIQGQGLKAAIRSAKEIEVIILNGLQQSNAVRQLGLEILSVDVLAVKATPEMSKALETETREALQKEADLAIYERRNFAVEQERRIRESELNTEIAVQEKRKQIQAKDAEIKVKDEENSRRLREMRMQADIAVEQQRTELVELQIETDRKLAKTKGFEIEQKLAPYRSMDWKTIMALSGNVSARENIAMAFRELAENSQRIENLHISPDLLDNLMQTQR